MARKILLAALILILCGLALILYQDPQIRLIFGSSQSSSTTSSFPSRFGISSATSGISIQYDAAAIIESLVGAGFAGIGLVLVVVEMLTGSVQRLEVREVE
ncbi:MAG: hypothetical protein JRN52_01050 [Nitrososphaerota archaeon]|nr:hypothetical protein [Nitrososphaerota archaeon]